MWALYNLSASIIIMPTHNLDVDYNMHLLLYICSVPTFAHIKYMYDGLGLHVYIIVQL